MRAVLGPFLPLVLGPRKLPPNAFPEQATEAVPDPKVSGTCDPRRGISRAGGRMPKKGPRTGARGGRGKLKEKVNFPGGNGINEPITVVI